jgi:vacuolar-type H+-ATPase subunit F/Vma7
VPGSCRLIGDVDSAAAFALTGIPGFTPNDAAEAKDAFQAALDSPDLLMLIITEGYALDLKDEISQHRLAGAPPMVIEIPENLSGEFSGHSLMDAIRSAVGISI